jgi:hypothetical protein
MVMSRRKTASGRRNMPIRVFATMQEADEADRKYWWSRTPAERLRECERFRRSNWGYGNGKSFPRFQRTLRIVDMHAQ